MPKWCRTPPKVQDLEEWHDWYAWFPVRIGHCTVWREVVQRRAQYWYDEMDWLYREKPHEQVL